MIDIICDNRKEVSMKTFEKMESALRMYDALTRERKEGSESEELLTRIEHGLEAIRGDRFYDVIFMFYVCGISREEIAARFNVSEVTISRVKKRLVEKIAQYVYTDEVVREKELL
jgi:RNA polymerase sigma factor (sigma-70 family)